jgi:hypothetical protein
MPARNEKVHVRTLLTLDYEVYFGGNTGTVARTLLEPTEALLRVANRHGARLVFFVDAGFILRLRAEMAKSASLRADYAAVCKQVQTLARAGHEIQLHIHPHWEDSYWDNGWRVVGTRYALHAFSAPEILQIACRYSALLRELAGPDAAFAYRAGGWVIQPFGKLRGALLSAGVCIDSTVYADGKSEGELQPFDFHGAPARSRWRFDFDPLVEDAQGPFLEVPIASRRLSPLFYWRLAALKKLGGAAHQPFGNGRAIPMGRRDLVRKLLRPSASVVSIDGYKASFLEAAARDYARNGYEDFVVIGHPKALTPYSLERLDRFLFTSAAREIATFSVYEKPQRLQRKTA